MKNHGPCPPDCPGRNENCHATCKIYLAAYEENQKRYKARQVDFALNDVVSIGVQKRMAYMRRKQKQR